MNNKDDIRDQFSPLLDGELSPEERASVEAALSHDAELLRELDAMKRVDDLFRAMPAVSAPDDFEVIVRDRIAPPRVAAVAAAAAAPPQRQIARRRFAPMLAAAATLIVCAGAIVFVIGSGANREQLASAPSAELRSMPSANAPAPQEPVPATAADTAAPHNEALANSALEQAKIVAAGDAAPAPAEPSHEAMEGIAGKDDPAQVADASATAGQPAPIQLQLGMPVDEGDRDARARAKESDDSVALGAVSNMAKPSAPADQPVPGEMKAEYRPASPPASAAGSALSEEAISPPPMPEIAAAAPAPAPPPQAPPASIEPEAIDRMPAGKPKFAEPKGGVPAKTKRDAAKESAPSTIQRSIGARSFTLRGGVWYERGYGDDATVALLRDSDAFRALVKEYANVEKLLELKEAVVFKAGERWYKMPPEKSPN